MSNISGGGSLGSTGTGLKTILGATKDGGGVAITTGKIGGYLTVPYACTITGWNISVDTGTATVEVWKIATGTAVPTVANTINTSGVAISSGTTVRSTTLSDYTTTTIAAFDVLAFNIKATASVTQLTFTLEVSRA